MNNRVPVNNCNNLVGATNLTEEKGREKDYRKILLIHMPLLIEEKFSKLKD